METTVAQDGGEFIWTAFCLGWMPEAEIFKLYLATYKQALIYEIELAIHKEFNQNNIDYSCRAKETPQSEVGVQKPN